MKVHKEGALTTKCNNSSDDISSDGPWTDYMDADGAIGLGDVDD
jgi:hypothetical protein